MAFVYGIEAEFPERVRVRRFGKSYEGRDLLEVMVKEPFYRTPDWDFCCFCPCGITLSYLPIHTISSDPYVSWL